MQLTDILKRLTEAAPFPDLESAERALASSLETLGYLLPGNLVMQLEAELPTSLHAALRLGREASLRDAPASYPQAELPPAHMLERLQEVCRALAPLLPGGLVESLIRELPAALGSAFAPRAQRRSAHAHECAHADLGSEHTLASGRPGGSRPLSEATPGSTHPLSTSQPSRTQTESLQSDNPHGSTKLSSAHGTTQEREHETLAETRPKH